MALLPESVRNRLPTSLGQLRRWTLGMVAGLRQWVRSRHTVEHDQRGHVESLVLPQVADDAGLQHLADGHGPVHHRTYRVALHSPLRTASEIVDWMREEPNEASPSAFALFEPRTRSGSDDLRLGTDHVVLLPGPWDGPVRVIGSGPTWFRLGTLPGHLEAGEIEFRAQDRNGVLEVVIESWARAGDPVMKVLHHDLAVAREVQLHMWTEVLRRAADHAGGEPDGDVQVVSEHVELEGVRRVPRDA